MALIAGGCDRQSSDKAQPPAAGPADAPVAGEVDRSHKGSLLPDFVLEDGAGKKLTLQSLKGKPLLINLWATWCAPCVVEMPALEALATKQGDALNVLTVSQDMQDTAKVAAFFKEMGFRNLEPWLDPATDLGFHYQGSLPVTVYYDAQGRELWRISGPREWGDAETTALLGEAL